MSLKRLDQEDITISVEAVTASAWSGNTPELTSFFRKSDQKDSTSGQFFHEVYNLDPDHNPEAEVQFSIAYGNIDGDGADPFTDDPLVEENTPTSVIYKQYRNLVFGAAKDSEGDDIKFKFDGAPSDEILVINIDRSRYKEKLLPGSLELTLEKDSNKIVLEDNSSVQSAQVFTDAGREFELILKSSDEIQNPKESYGKIYPDIGVIILNAEALTDTLTDGGLDLNLDLENNEPLDDFFNAIDTGKSFKLQSEETLSSNIVFIRARNAEFNYTTNPSTTTTDGEIRDPVLVNSPQTFITTVGLYNDRNELLAVAKLSRPLLKDFTKEALLRIKLDF